MFKFDNVYVSPRLRVALANILSGNEVRRFWSLVDRLRLGKLDIPGLRVEKLRTSRGKVYSARLNLDLRVIFSMYTSDAGRSLVIWDANHHDDAYDRLDRACIPSLFESAQGYLETVSAWGEGVGESLANLELEGTDDEDLTRGLLLFKVPYYVMTEPDKYQQFERNIDRFLRLTEEQEEILARNDRACLIRGAAGTGKTSLALFWALAVYETYPHDDVFFFTYQDELACVCRCYKVNLVGAENEPGVLDEGGIRVFSYLEFCRHYLRSNIKPEDISWQWINRNASIKHLNEIIKSRSRWHRTLVAEDVYSLIYSILKGRFVPGTDTLPATPADFQRIFKGYDSQPENLEDILEVFGHYDERLKRANQRDEADLIAYCYQSLKDKAQLSSADRATWIVIDEIQDFTELEWKSILLFWENKARAEAHPSFPFLCGDTNQRISRSGFRWNDLDSYVESILRSMHRPNSINKVQLHANVRNTRQIYQFGSFLRSLAPEGSADLGSPPVNSGSPVQIVVGTAEEFREFLALVNEEEESTKSAPLVVLCEHEEHLDELKQSLPHDDGIFMMPLNVCKGLEFEDLIIYRMFALMAKIGARSGDDATPNSPTGAAADTIVRLFDLWYMAAMRARKNLLIFLTTPEWEQLGRLCGGRTEALDAFARVNLSEAKSHLLQFFHRRERFIPNYNVVFLERVKAQDAWDEYKKIRYSEARHAEFERMSVLKEKALRLWKRCRDLRSLGRAYLELENYAEAIPYLLQSALESEAARCYEKLGKYDLAAQAFENDHDFDNAASCHERAGNHQRAAELYEMHRQWLQAANNYSLLGNREKAADMFEKAQMWKAAADIHRQKQDFAKAAELYTRCNEHEVAAEMYLKVKDKLDAARCYLQAGHPDKAGGLFEALNRWAEAGEAYESARMHDQAARMYSKAGKLKEAARAEENAGNHAGAGAAYERMKQWEAAAECYLSMNDKEKAADCLEKAKKWTAALQIWLQLEDWYRVARCLEAVGDYKVAYEHYSRVDAHNEAALCQEKLGQWVLAADLYLKAGNLSGAASMLAKLGRRLDAARLYLLSGQLSIGLDLASAGTVSGQIERDLRCELGQWADETGRLDLAGAIYESLSDYTRAADRYQKATLLSKAARCFERMKLFDRAAQLYLQDRQVEQAASCFVAADDLRKAAECYETVQKWNEACRLYEQLRDQDGINRCRTAVQWL